jgi:hypothetical protein
MRPVNQKLQKERRAKAARRFSRFLAQGLRSSETSPNKVGVCFESWKAEPSVTGFAADRGGSVADAFFGASPVVASALGIRSGATPRGPIHVTTPLRNDTLKPDISTLPELGHFYFALTGWIRRVPTQSENFRFSAK